MLVNYLDFFFDRMLVGFISSSFGVSTKTNKKNIQVFTSFSVMSKLNSTIQVKVGGRGVRKWSRKEEERTDEHVKSPHPSSWSVRGFYMLVCSFFLFPAPFPYSLPPYLHLNNGCCRINGGLVFSRHLPYFWSDSSLLSFEMCAVSSSTNAHISSKYPK